MAYAERATDVASVVRALLMLCLSAFAAPAAAHDFWIEPQSFVVAPGADVSFTLQVGHGSERQRSAIRRSRIVRFVAIGRDGNEADVRASLTLGGEANDGSVRLSEPGAHLLALQSDNSAISRLPAQRFNAYLRLEGLTPAL